MNNSMEKYETTVRLHHHTTNLTRSTEEKGGIEEENTNPISSPQSRFASPLQTLDPDEKTKRKEMKQRTQPFQSKRDNKGAIPKNPNSAG